jgi:hypothetical protein
MVKKTLLAAAVGGFAVGGANLAPVANTVDVNATIDDATTISEPELQADCPWCWPYPNCFPGDPCGNCG